MTSARAIASTGDLFEDTCDSSRALPPLSESAFYGRYAWCLDPHLKIEDARQRLADEIGKLTLDLYDWQTSEVATNIYLFAGALLNCVDEYLRGPGLKLPKRLAAHRLGRLGTRILDDAAAAAQPKRHVVRQWRHRLLSALDQYLPCLLFPDLPNCDQLYASAEGLASLARSRLPSALEAQFIGVPSPFRRLDLTHHDIISLGRQLVESFPDRSHSILLIGLRTSGSFFAPLIRCFLQDQGYRSAAVVTIQPDKGPGRQESAGLKRYARENYIGVIVDDPPHSGGAVLRAVGFARRAGFPHDRITALVPLHPARRNCFGPLTGTLVVSLPAERWHKFQLLDLTTVRARLVEYYDGEGFPFVQVTQTARTNEFERRMNSMSFDDRGARLKRVFEVNIRSTRGEETRFVLAKSVGWGWLGYHAFIAGTELSGLVPRLLGLRDGILYTEWIPQPATLPRESLLDASANYIAVRSLRLRVSSKPGVIPQRHQNGVRLLAKICAKSYGPFLVDQLMRPQVERWLFAAPCPQPTLIDGKMGAEEWIAAPVGFLKSDFEHHGMGKGEVNGTDPAFDLAQTILELEADRAEEETLVRRYVQLSGDATIANRMFQQKLLAGVWAMDRARQQLFAKSHDAARAHALHERYSRAWNFLTVHATRECGRLCQPASATDWQSPLIVVDVDGVIDRRVFGFPCTTAAGIEAFSVLRAHDRTIVLNTARSAAEVKEYCDAYQLAGGIAEHGSYLWDAVAQKGRILLDSEAIQQLGILRQHLSQIPGVFLDNRYHYSIRAFTYHQPARGLDEFLSASLRPKGADTIPLSPLLMNDLLVRTGVTRLAIHQTSIDTAVVVKGINKGTGLKALTDWCAAGGFETIAIGDSRPDLDMFRVATRSFAPGHIGCRTEARLLGCWIASKPYQRGFAEIARQIVHPSGRPCERCADAGRMDRKRNAWIRFLQAADRSFAANVARGLFHHGALEALLQR
jgi:hydroxymethylpyrimidine pyrophosphatase-like HAD family hydrolase